MTDLLELTILEIFSDARKKNPDSQFILQFIIPTYKEKKTNRQFTSEKHEGIEERQIAVKVPKTIEEGVS